MSIISYSDLMSIVGRFLGYGPTSTDWTVAQTAEIDEYVQAGVRQVYYPPVMEGVEPGYEWSFLKPRTALDTTADDAAQDLPADTGRVLGNFYYEESEHRRPVVQVSEARLLSLLSRSDDTGAPQMACVRHKAQEEGEAQLLEVAWWPIPNDAYTLTYQYEAYTGKLSSANPYPLGGQRNSELYAASCLSVAEQRANDVRGLNTETFGRMLVSGIEADRKQGAKYFGPMSQPDTVAVPRHGCVGSNYPITYKDETW